MLTSDTRIRKPHRKQAKARLIPRKKPLQERATGTLQAILGATAHILSTRGYAKTTTNHIAERAGVSIGSLYQYFPNKDAIVLALLEALIEEERQMVAQALAETRGQDLEKVIRRLVESTFDFFAKKGELRRILFEQTPENIRRDRPHLLMKRLSRAILQIFRESGLHFKREASLLDAYLIVSAVEASLRVAVYRYSRKVDRGQMIEDITALVMTYLAGR